MKLIFSILSCLFLLVGCAPSVENHQDGNYKVRIPIVDKSGKYHLQTVTIHHVRDLAGMMTDNVYVKTKGDIKLVKKGEGGYLQIKDKGRTPSGHFIKDGDTYVPSDYETLVMTTLLYMFETIRSFYDGYQANTGLVFPRTVLLDANITAGRSLNLGYDNATYMPASDLFVINPYTDDHLPISMNQGILTHEYFHSIFAHQIFAAAKEMNTSGPEVDETTECYNTYELESFNEGTADFFGYESTGDPSFGVVSLDKKVSGTRSLDVFKPSPFNGYGSEERYFLASRKSDDPSCPQNEEFFDPHILGASIAHLYYVMGQEWGQDVASRQILAFMGKYARLFLKTNSFLGMKDVLPLLYSGQPATTRLCHETRLTFSDPAIHIEGCP